MLFRHLVASALALSHALGAAQNTTVKVVQLSVDGRFDNPLDLENPHPTLAWQIIDIGNCTRAVCPGDRQNAFEIQAASSIENLRSGQLLWESGRRHHQSQSVRFESTLSPRDDVFWRVRVWDAENLPSAWSDVAFWSVGLLTQADWGQARWIDYPSRGEQQPLPLFRRQFSIAEGVAVVKARLYLSGVGMHYATVNGEAITDEVLAPGYSNYQLSSEYRTYDIKDVLRSGDNVVGVRLGNGPAYIRRSVTNEAVGRNAPYAWWQSQLKGNSTLVEDAAIGAFSVRLTNASLYHLGGSINIDTSGGGDNLESRVITAIDTSRQVISFSQGLSLNHSVGATVTGSGNNIAATDPAAGAAVTPRLIGRLEITFNNGSSAILVTDRSWSTKLGPLITNAWYSGSDFDARRNMVGWDRPDVPFQPSEWTRAGIAPPPNLVTKLVARAADPVKVQEHFIPISITNPFNGIWVFDLGQNIAGWPLLSLPEMSPGITVKMVGAEALNANGTVNQQSIGIGDRGTDVFNTYTTAGRARGETWHPDFNYFAMQWVQVTGLPTGFRPNSSLITGVRLQADLPVAGTFTSSSSRMNRIHKMSRYSFASNLMSVITDCPGREKLSYPADYTMSIGAIHRNVNLNAMFRTTMRHLVEAQSIADTSMAGNVPLKAPVYDWGYTGRFGDEINWGNAIVLVPSLMYDLYNDTKLMSDHYDQMKYFVNYIQREKVQGYIVDAALADWVEDDARTSGRITGTWGYYLTIKAMANMASLTGHHADAAHYADLASRIRNAFNEAFYNERLGYYTNFGNNSTINATQTAQALALDAGLVLDKYREKVLDALVNLTYSYPSEDGQGPHLSGGTLGLGPIVRSLAQGGRDDILWYALQQNDQPSYGFFMAPTEANPQGLTTIGERWNRNDSLNHMILAQIDEWFHKGIAGIQPVALDTFNAVEKKQLIFQPKLVGDLQSAAGTYQTPKGEARSEWSRTAEGSFTLKVTVPANTVAEVRVPTTGHHEATERALFVGVSDHYALYEVPSGTHTFNSAVEVIADSLSKSLYGRLNY